MRRIPLWGTDISFQDSRVSLYRNTAFGNLLGPIFPDSRYAPFLRDRFAASLLVGGFDLGILCDDQPRHCWLSSLSLLLCCPNVYFGTRRSRLPHSAVHGHHLLTIFSVFGDCSPAHCGFRAGLCSDESDLGFIRCLEEASQQFNRIRSRPFTFFTGVIYTAHLSFSQFKVVKYDRSRRLFSPDFLEGGPSLHTAPAPQIRGRYVTEYLSPFFAASPVSAQCMIPSEPSFRNMP